MACSLHELIYDDVVKIMRPAQTVLKWRRQKYPVPVDSSLLRRSSRLNADKKDFEDKASANLLALLF